jgi:hypothetical protein
MIFRRWTRSKVLVKSIVSYSRGTRKARNYINVETNSTKKGYGINICCAQVEDIRLGLSLVTETTSTSNKSARRQDGYTHAPLFVQSPESPKDHPK